MTNGRLQRPGEITARRRQFQTLKALDLGSFQPASFRRPRAAVSAIVGDVSWLAWHAGRY